MYEYKHNWAHELKLEKDVQEQMKGNSVFTY